MRECLFSFACNFSTYPLHGCMASLTKSRISDLKKLNLASVNSRFAYLTPEHIALFILYISDLYRKHKLPLTYFTCSLFADDSSASPTVSGATGTGGTGTGTGGGTKY